MTTNLTKGMTVHFGRTHGEKTLGRIIRVSGKTVTVEQLEARGTMRSYPVGTKWRVAPMFVQPADGSAVGEPDEARPVPATKAPWFPATPRSESAILDEIETVECMLSPENLTCDGELPASAVRSRAASLNSRLRALQAELTLARKAS